MFVLNKLSESESESESTLTNRNWSDCSGSSTTTTPLFTCVLNSVERGHISTLSHSSFWWRGARILNALQAMIRNLSNCDVLVFKDHLDNDLTLLPDVPCTTNMVTASQEQW